MQKEMPIVQLVYAKTEQTLPQLLEEFARKYLRRAAEAERSHAGGR